MPRETTPVVDLGTAIRPLLSPREKDVLLFAARGYDRVRTGTAISLSASSVKAERTIIFRKLHVSNIVDAIKEALLNGEILPQQVLGRLNLEELSDLINGLSTTFRRTFNALGKRDTKTSEAKLASALNFSPRTVRNHIRTIGRQIGSRNKEQTTAISVALMLNEESERACLMSLASVVNHSDLMEVLENVSYRSALSRLRERLGTSGIFDTIFSGIKSGVLNRDELTKGFTGDNFSELTDADIDLLERFSRDDGKDSTYAKAAEKYNTTPDDIASRFASIRNQLDTDIHPAVLYYAIKHKPIVRRGT